MRPNRRNSKSSLLIQSSILLAEELQMADEKKDLYGRSRLGKKYKSMLLQTCKTELVETYLLGSMLQLWNELVFTLMGSC